MQDLLLKLRGPNWRETGLIPDLAIPVIETALTSPTALPRGAVLCTATLGTPIRDADLAAKLGLPFVNDSDRDEHSNWGWPLTDLAPLRPY
ncbi:hypothetical protein, partial [Pseudomonas aeruginosa]|uniref:hypothetical protein n=1 Tax=Pseudomonas aeruginosa TaxID=287 RepID=UPI00197D6BE5